jgi:hypothetical protein
VLLLRAAQKQQQRADVFDGADSVAAYLRFALLLLLRRGGRNGEGEFEVEGGLWE